jgi:uncharacterized protein YqfA (UPF0365 family)
MKIKRKNTGPVGPITRQIDRFQTINAAAAANKTASTVCPTFCTEISQAGRSVLSRSAPSVQPRLYSIPRIQG